jgi:hypothetical protein
LSPTGFVSPTLQNRAIFDYRNHLLSGGLNHIDQVFQVGNAAFTQELFGGLGGFEVAYDQQKTRSQRLLPFSFGDNGGGSPASAISIDVARYLSNDQPNPNVGRPFIDQQGITDRTQTGTARGLPRHRVLPSQSRRTRPAPVRTDPRQPRADRPVQPQPQ